MGETENENKGDEGEGVTVFFFDWKEKEVEEVDAMSLSHAKKVFKVTVLFPERFLKEEDVIDVEYRPESGRNVYRWREGAEVPIYESATRYGGPGNQIGGIPIEECIDVDVDEVVEDGQSVAGLLSGREVEGEESDGMVHLSDELIETVEGVTKTLARSRYKPDMRRTHDLIRRREHELEQKKNELEQMQSQLQMRTKKLKEELREKSQLLKAVEVFLGTDSWVQTLRTGAEADTSEPLTLLQRRLYMDEEVGIYEQGGLDFQSIEKFDEWVVRPENFERIIWPERAVVALRVRRKSKDYGDALFNLFRNVPNKRTYLLIRNGENLYRIWTKADLPEKLFPGRQEYERILEGEEGDSLFQQPIGERKKRLKERHRRYMMGITAIQGLIERTDVLGAHLRGRVNLMQMDSIDEKWVRLVRDAEEERLLGEKMPSWKEYKARNQDAIEKGKRVVIVKTPSYRGEDRGWRTGPYNVPKGRSPSSDTAYVVQEKRESALSRGSFKILWHPEDRVYERGGDWNGHERKHRVPWFFYPDEALAVDEVTLAEIDYYLANREERNHYLDLIPALLDVREIKRKESTYESHLVRKIAGDLSLDEDEYSLIWKRVYWWKQKNDWKRGVEGNEELAYRMVRKKVEGDLEDHAENTNSEMTA